MKRTNGRIHPEDDFETGRHMQASDDRSSPYPRERSALLPFALGAAIGGIIGASIAILYAPTEGSELRRGMSEALDDLVDGAKGLVKDVKTSAEKIFSDGLGADIDEEAESPLARTRERVDDILEDADRAIAEARRRSTAASRATKPKEDEE
ncbi:MAG TPA: YtxH domain-containing protein [Candidatus Kapabacteria bacterium]|nr:YtxH domain-containing protein [Candidatus Kapabacteria bacterium]